MMRKINERGEISTNTVITTVIAIIGIVLLGYAVSKIYDNFANQESKNAQSGLNNLILKINSINAGDSTTATLTGLNGNWFMAGWNRDESGRPEKCFSGSCICICSKAGTTIGIDESIGKNNLNKVFLASSCQKTGFCSVVEINEVSIIGGLVRSTTASPAPTVALSLPTGGQSVIPVSYIIFPANLLILKIEKKDNVLKITNQQ